ncbi:MAG: hypothetical protein WDW38_007906 [Sanguina aurantia]
MFSDQVMPCPNPDSCGYASRQAALQQLQVSVRKTYQQLQQQQAEGSSTPTQSSRGTRSLLASPHTPATPPPAFPAAPTLQSPPSDPPATRTQPSDGVSAQSSQDALVVALMAAVRDRLAAYADAQCSPGYTGQLCGSCADGFGTQGIAACSRCPRQTLNDLFYILATFVTFVLLVYTLYCASTVPRERAAEQARGLHMNESKRVKRAKYFFDPRDPFEEDSEQAAAVTLRIFLSYLQVLGLLQNVSQLYPNSLQTYLNGYVQATSARAWVSLDCSLPVYSSISKATITTLINALQPAYVAVFCWLFFLTSSVLAYWNARTGGKVAKGINVDRPIWSGIRAHFLQRFTLSNVVRTLTDISLTRLPDCSIRTPQLCYHDAHFDVPMACK